MSGVTRGGDFRGKSSLMAQLIEGVSHNLGDDGWGGTLTQL